MAALNDGSASCACFLKIWLEEIGYDPCYRIAFGCLADGSVDGRYKIGAVVLLMGPRISWGVTSMQPTAIGKCCQGEGGGGGGGVLR